MLSRRYLPQRTGRIVGTAVGACALVATALLGAAPAIAEPAGPAIPTDPTPDRSPADTRFLDVVKQLDVPMESPDQAIQAGHSICEQVEAGRIQPARTVRGILSGLTANGLQKGVAVHLIWGAVDSYCPQNRTLVGR